MTTVNDPDFMRRIKPCPAPGCGRLVRPENTCCLEHWKALPRGLRIQFKKPGIHPHRMRQLMAEAHREHWSVQP